MDPTSIIPERLKERLADSLVELLAGSAEQLGGSQIAGRIRKLSSKSDLRQSINRALETGIQHFIEDYVSQDEDLVAAIQSDDLFWQSEMVQDALVRLVSRPGAWLRDERETVGFHFETVLPKRVNRERVDRAVSFLLYCVAEELWSLPGAQEIREAYIIQFQKFSAEAQREQVALARQQLQATSQLSADLRQALLQLVGLVEQKVLAAPASVAMLTSPKPYHNLPQPTYTQFVGRDEELAWLKQRLSPADRAWQIAITGIGGVGKSALALAIGHEYRQRYNELPPEERFEAIVWVSAKEEVLTAFGREQASVPEQVLHTLEDVYTAIARVLEREDITRAQPEEQNALVEKALKRQRTLLIMDNLESVKDDRIKAFLRNLPLPTKAIITSREGLDVADVKPLTGLVWEEAEILIKDECRLREVSLTPYQQWRVFELTAGLPLPIKLSVARIAGGESFALVDRWLGDAVGELPEYCVKGQIDLARQRDPKAWTVLLVCSLFDRDAGASREALGEIADLSLADRDSALAQLQRLLLVNRRDNDRFWVLPMVQRFARFVLADTSTGEVEVLVRNWIGWMARYAESLGPQAEQDTSRMLGLAREYPNLLLALRWCQNMSYLDGLLRLSSGIWPYAYRSALLADLGEILQAWLDSANATHEEMAIGAASLQLGRLASIQEQDTDALMYLDRAEPILEKYKAYSDLAEAWATRSLIVGARGDPSQAFALANRIYELGIRTGNSETVLLGAQRLAELESQRGDLERALEWVEKVEPLAQKSGHMRRRAALLYRRARILTRQGKYEEAESILETVHSMNSTLGGRRYAAADLFRLAEIYAVTGRTVLARQAAEEARSALESMGAKGTLSRVSQFLDGLDETAPALVSKPPDWTLDNGY